MPIHWVMKIAHINEFKQTELPHRNIFWLQRFNPQRDANITQQSLLCSLNTLPPQKPPPQIRLILITSHYPVIIAEDFKEHYKCNAHLTCIRFEYSRQRSERSLLPRCSTCIDKIKFLWWDLFHCIFFFNVCPHLNVRIMQMIRW